MVHQLVELIWKLSAPPFMDIGRDESNSEMESGTVHEIHIAEESTESHSFNLDKKEQDSICDPGESGNSGVLKDTAAPVSSCQMDSVNQSVYYSTSGQNAWQSLVAYDTCFRLCLNAWTRGCMEAPEFLRDECLLLRNAFGLHTLLLQPRGAQSTGKGMGNTAEMACPSKVKKTIGKIRVEVRKLRIIPRRKLKSTNSLRGAMYMQVGAEYVRHVSSLVKNSITSFRHASSSLTSEELLRCSFHLKSSLEDGKHDSVQDFTLRPGTGDYHEFFPESQGDALILEVQDLKKTVQGRATIPVSSLIENPNDRMKWWPIYHEDHECVGKIQLSVYETVAYDDTTHMKNGPIAETLAYDILLESAMRAQNFHAQNLWIDGPWKWLLSEFSDYYGVSDSYTKLRYLSHVMNVATPTKDCLKLIYQLLVPVIKTRGEKWAIWNARNDWVWNKKVTSVVNSLVLTKSYLDQWIKAHENSLITPSGEPGDGAEKWVRPQNEYIKVNVDAALFEADGYFGTAAVARDHTGNLVEARSRRWDGIVAPEIAEAMGVREALSWIKGKAWPMVSVETDCWVVVQAIRSSVVLSSTFGLVIKDCKALCSQLGSVQLNFVYRSANIVAHSLARDSCYQTERTISNRGFVPVSFVNLLIVDGLRE